MDKYLRHLKEKHNAVILAHNYQRPEVQDTADYLGDSLSLAMQATKVDADVIVFCGVDFMAETAKILNPDKTVVHPESEARCPMAAMVDVDGLQALKNKHPEAAVVSYVNTTAQVKAASDICCTSSNAVKVIKNLPERDIIFVPDENLGRYVQRFLPDKDLLLWPGVCPTHDKITPGDITALQREHPHSETMVHPECRPEVVDLADHVLSTGGMVSHAIESGGSEFIVGTEKELCYRLSNEAPDKHFYSIEKARCPNMKKITLEKVLKSMDTLTPTVSLSERVMTEARHPLQRMMDVGRGD
ncbi:MAG: quinolinate synthase NadA [Thermoplasmatota archaeon]